MSGARLHTLLPELTSRQPVMVIGAAVIDVIADAYALPWRGCDIELKQQSVNVGGCALNIAVALKRLGIEAGNALPLGQGVWAEIIRNRMAKEDLISLIDNAEGDNGWCLALVEPDGERTFMSFSGVENQWNRQWLARLTVAPGSLLYFSGYQLASPCGELLVEWLEELQDVTPFIDFGPRIGDIPDALLARIMACRPLVSLNRQEAEIAAERFALSAEITTLGKQWQEKFAAPLIVRLGMVFQQRRFWLHSGISNASCRHHWGGRQSCRWRTCRAGLWSATGGCRITGQCSGVVGCRASGR